MPNKRKLKIISSKDNEYSKQYKIIVDTIRRTLLWSTPAYLVSLFTVYVISDEFLIKHEPIVPIGNSVFKARVTYSAFLSLGSLFLCISSVYLIIYYHKLLDLIAEIEKNIKGSLSRYKLPYFFIENDIPLRILTYGLIYAIPILTLLIFIYRANPLPGFIWFLPYIYLLVTGFTISHRLRISLKNSKNPIIIKLIFATISASTCLIIILIAYGLFDAKNRRAYDLTEANFNGIDLSWFKPDLSGSNLSDSKLIAANLNKLDLTCRDQHCVNLTHSDLTAASFDSAKLIKADLSHSQMACKVIDTQIKCTSFHSAKLQQATLNYSRIIGADLSLANFNQATLKNVVMKCKDETILLIDSEKNKTIKKCTTLTHAQFKGADLSNANITGANFQHAKFECIKTNQAKKKRCANLENAQFDNADLRNTSFRGANLRNTSFSSSLMSSGTDFTDAKGLTCSQLMQAEDWHKAKYDKHMTCGRNKDEPK